MTKTRPALAALACVAFGVQAQPLTRPAMAPEATALPDVSTSGSTTGIVPLPLDTAYPVLRVFQNTSIVRAPSGAPIHVLIQRGVPAFAAIQARAALGDVLADVPGSRYGSDKGDVGELLSATNSALLVFRSERAVPAADSRVLARTGLQGMALMADQILLLGEPPALAEDAVDSSLAAAVRLVYEFALVDARPEYAEQVARACELAVQRGVFRAPAAPALSRSQLAAVYLATALEVWYGMWEGRPAPARGLYACTTLEDLRRLDPAIADLIPMFFSDRRASGALVWPGVRGSVSLEPAPGDPAHPAALGYDHAALTGRLDASLSGNRRDNVLTGNFGDNVLVGGAGDDLLDGADGHDVAVYTGPVHQYHVERQGDVIFVIDLAPDRDGSDVVRGVERLRFADAEFDTDPTR